MKKSALNIVQIARVGCTNLDFACVGPPRRNSLHGIAPPPPITSTFTSVQETTHVFDAVDVVAALRWGNCIRGTRLYTHDALQCFTRVFGADYRCVDSAAILLRMAAGTRGVSHLTWQTHASCAEHQRPQKIAAAYWMTLPRNGVCP